MMFWECGGLVVSVLSVDLQVWGLVPISTVHVQGYILKHDPITSHNTGLYTCIK